MLVANLWDIVKDHYASAVDASKWNGGVAKFHVFILFAALPLIVGITLGYFSPLWGGMLQILITVLGVLTGFSINSLVLLMRHSTEDSYNLESRMVDTARDYCLYAVLVGLILIVASLVGFALSKSAIDFHRNVKIASSVVLYTIVAHYFATFGVLTHRFYTLINGDAIENG